MRFILLLLLTLSLIPSGCGESASGDDDSFASAEEARYAKAGRPFAQAIAKKDYDRAYAMLSSHARANLSAAGFRAMHEDARREYFAPAKSDPAQVVETSGHILAGRPDPDGDDLDQRMDLMTFQRYVGDVPENVPEHIRRASLCATFYDRHPDDIDCRACLLTYLLVEDAGELRVAHFFYRWPDMLD